MKCQKRLDTATRTPSSTRARTHTHAHTYEAHRITLTLTLSRHFSLSLIASGRSSGLHLISSHSCCMYVLAGLPALARPYVEVHRSTSLMSSSLLLQQCPACLVRLTWIVFVMGGRWSYSWCFVGCSPDGDTEHFDNVTEVLQGDTLAPYLFIISLDYVLRTSIDKIRVNGFELTKKRSRRYSTKTITDADYVDDIALLANTHNQAETLLHSLERAAAGIGPFVNAHKMYFNQAGHISTLDGISETG